MDVRGLTIIPWTRVGYELLDSGRGVEHQSGYPTYKLISNKQQVLNANHVSIEIV